MDRNSIEENGFITHNVRAYFYDESYTHNGIAVVLWLIDMEYYSWGIKKIYPIVTEISVKYDTTDNEGNTITDTKMLTDNIQVDNYDHIPMYPKEILICKNKIVVDFGGAK